MKFSQITLFVVLAIAVGLFLYLTQEQERELIPVQTFNTWQQVDVPEGFPVERDGQSFLPSLNVKLDLFRGEQRFRIPVAVRFDWPMGGAASGALTYNAQSYWEMNERRGGRHTGDDLNGIGGMNTDLGDPVFSVADGLVVYAGEPSQGWGKTVVIAHRLEDGTILQSMYSHLQSIGVALDQVVSRGQRVGKVGGANGLYPAHLHFEIHESEGLSLGAGYVTHRTNRLDPEATLKRLRGAFYDDLGESVSSVVRRIERENAGF